MKEGIRRKIPTIKSDELRGRAYNLEFCWDIIDSIDKVGWILHENEIINPLDFHNQSYEEETLKRKITQKVQEIIEKDEELKYLKKPTNPNQKGGENDGNCVFGVRKPTHPNRSQLRD